MPSYKVPIGSYESFKKHVLGKCFDIDGYYGCQCWDGVALLYQQLNATLYTGPQGIASECWTNQQSREANTLPTLMVQITRKEDLKRGDIIVLNKPDNLGHIAFCDEDYRGIMINLLGENQGVNSNPTHGVPFNISEYNISSFLGGFRYLKWSGVVPPKPPKSTNRSHFKFYLYSKHES